MKIQLTIIMIFVIMKSQLNKYRRLTDRTVRFKKDYTTNGNENDLDVSMGVR